MRDGAEHACACAPPARATDTTKHVNDVWSIDLSGRDGYTWHQVHTIGERPGPRENSGSCMLANRYMVVHGGYGFHDGYLNTTYVLDTHVDPMIWTRPTLTGTRPDSRHGFSLMRIEDDEALLVAGLSEYGFEQDTHILQLGVGNEAYYQGLTHEPA